MTQTLAAAPVAGISDYPTVVCPTCHQPAWIEWRALIESTDGPVEHLKIRCADRHWFMLPTHLLPAEYRYADAVA